jgi:hypothetical protein
MSEKPDGIATPADFKKLAEAAAWTEPERVELPESKLTIVIRRPTRYYWALRRAEWPAELREKVDILTSKGEFNVTQLEIPEIEFMLRQHARMIEEAFVSPKCSLKPGPDQFDPDWMKPEDSQFLVRYIGGQVLPNGQDLEEFHRGKQGELAGGGSDGETLRRPPDETSPTDGS